LPTRFLNDERKQFKEGRREEQVEIMKRKEK
jgi:hypothetical protein